ncbi:hypothetical protein ABEB36_014195 [Hypothenemus hampei]|uniref:Uncharacterized protein n=1 Tax=Hypothenemus hampei TaxID=57062 RepID=A0ABD1E3L7_HYPHA
MAQDNTQPPLYRNFNWEQNKRTPSCHPEIWICARHNGNNHDTPSPGYNNLRPDQMPQKRSKQENPERSIQKRGKTVTNHSTTSPGEEEEPRTPQAPYNSANKCKRHKC